MDKFEEFQTTLAKSNEVFTTFRQEMEKVSEVPVTHCLLVYTSVDSLLTLVFLISDDKEDKETGKRDNTVEDQMGEQQPGAAPDG